MIELLISPKAISDLEDIFEYTLNKWSMQQALIYQDFLFISMNSILMHPNIGQEYKYKKGNYRKLNSSKHLIFYRIEKGKCIIVRVLHERMDLKSRV